MKNILNHQSKNVNRLLENNEYNINHVTICDKNIEKTIKKGVDKKRTEFYNELRNKEETTGTK